MLIRVCKRQNLLALGWTGDIMSAQAWHVNAAGHSGALLRINGKCLLQEANFEQTDYIPSGPPIFLYRRRPPL
jgi:hypothetical protein